MVCDLIILSSQENILARKITFRSNNKPLISTLIQLSKESKINIVFNSADIPSKNVNFYSPNYTLDEILDYLLQDTGLRYEVVDHQIVILNRKSNKNIEEFLLKGYIYSSENGEKLNYGNIYLEDLSDGTVSNEYGFFSLKLPKGKNKLVFSYLGYFKQLLEIDMQKDLIINVKLNPEPAIELKEILVTESRLPADRLEYFEPDKIYQNKVNKITSLLGENDILRLTASQPGVISGADGFGGLHVRGSKDGDNMLLLDGVPVFNAKHALGLFSTFNSDVIKTSSFLKGSFPARYGGSLGSVLDIRTRDGNNKKYGGEIDLGLLTTKVLAEGPLFGENSSVIVGYRRTLIDLWKKPISNFLNSVDVSKDYNYYFYDLNMKVNWKLSYKNNVYLSFYNGHDSFGNLIKKYNSSNPDFIVSQNSNKWDWGNTLLSMHWTDQVGRSLFMTTALYYSAFKLNSYSYDVSSIDKNPSAYFYEGRRFDNNISDKGIKLDFDLNLNKNFIRWGVSFSNRKMQPTVYISNNTLNNINSIPDEFNINPFDSGINEFRVYAENKWELNKSIIVNYGIHNCLHNTADTNFISFEPRLRIEYKINKIGILSLSAGKMSQSLHTFTNNTLGLNSEMMIPSTKRLFPEKIWHYEAGIESKLTKYAVLSFRTYYKNAENVVSHKDGSYFIISQYSHWDTNIPIGKSKMYGFESQFDLSLKRFNSTINYTWSKSLNLFESINKGNYFDDRFSRRHMFNASGTYRFGKRLILNLNMVFGSGNPYTIPTQLTPDHQLIYEKVNNYKLPGYKRIDIGVLSNISVGKTEQSVEITIFNLFNTANPLYVTFENVENQLSTKDFNQIYVLPRLPSINYRIKF